MVIITNNSDSQKHPSGQHKQYCNGTDAWRRGSLYSVDSVAEEDNAALHTPEFPNSLNLNGLTPHRINMKTGAPIMLFKKPTISSGPDVLM